ncbi:hypothetical protein CJ469_03511 [Nocardia farcinica]|nr:hypothetical protein CJ469_03511 [Nocardia farcinica]PFX02114.1 hypothetical protein CJ468_05964 [Nocardia farcinica]
MWNRKVPTCVGYGDGRLPTFREGIVRTTRTAIAGLVTLAVATGCSALGGDTEGTATPATQAPDTLLNPCTDLPDEWLRETGLDPASKSVTVDPAGESTWRICRWDAVDLPYMVSVMSSNKTLAETRTNTSVNVLGETTIGARPALLTRVKSDAEDELTCYVTFPAEQGSFTISLGWRASRPVTADRCELAIKHATDLEQHLPK